MSDDDKNAIQKVAEGVGKVVSSLRGENSESAEVQPEPAVTSASTPKKDEMLTCSCDLKKKRPAAEFMTVHIVNPDSTYVCCDDSRECISKMNLAIRSMSNHGES